MKKILFLFMMNIGLFSSLHATDSIHMDERDSYKSHSVDGADMVIKTPSDVTFVKVNILHKDTLMYSWGEGIDNIGKSSLALHVSKGLPGIGGGKFEVGWQKTTLDTINI